MKKEYILTQEQKDDKKRKIEENRVKKSEQMKRKKTIDERDNYDDAEPTHQQIQLPIVQSTDPSLYHPIDGQSVEKVFLISPDCYHCPLDFL